MRKTHLLVLTVLLSISLLTGCRGNVSSRPDGQITGPTETTTVPTMPGTDTVPLEPHPSTAPDSDETHPAGRARQAHPGTMPHRRERN